MTPAEWIALVGAGVTVTINLGGYLIAYGAMKATVAGLAARVTTLEAEIGALTQLKVDVAELKTSVGFVVEQLRDLNASIRWMRDPAPPYGPPRGAKL